MSCGHAMQCRAPKLVHVDAMHVSRLSCRAWGVYILLDMYANALRYVQCRRVLGRMYWIKEATIREIEVSGLLVWDCDCVHPDFER